MTDLADLTLVEAADAVRNGDATSMELQSIRGNRC